MEVKYTISQVSKFTGVTIDAIRLYEKEGLICPKRDDNNNYRYYDVELIRRIIFIAFYRKIDVSIPEIAPLITSSSLSDIRSTFDELINSNTKKIEQLHTKIKKLTVLNKSLGELSSNIGIYSLCVMPKCYRMMEKINADTESHKMGAAISSPMFTFGNIGFRLFVLLYAYDYHSYKIVAEENGIYIVQYAVTKYYMGKKTILCEIDR